MRYLAPKNKIQKLNNLLMKITKHEIVTVLHILPLK